MTGETVSKQVVTSYYENHFKPFELAKIIGIDDFDRREFGWVKYPDPGNESGKKLFTRNERFPDINALVSRLPGIVPYKLYYGAVYRTQWHGSIKGIPWEHNELHFDIDANDFDFARRAGMCKCAASAVKDERKKVCNDCLVLIKEAGQFLMDTLEEDFAIPACESIVYFSGARGIHVHYPSVKKLGNTETEEKRIRKNLVSYISVVKNEERVIQEDNGAIGVKKTGVEPVVTGSIDSRTLRDRIDRTVYPWFFTRAPDQTLKKMRLNQAAVDLAKILFSTGKSMGDVIVELSRRGLVSDRQKSRIRDTALAYRYPRYDGGATSDVRKVLKVPRSIDCSTGYIVCKIRDLNSFEIDDVDHVTNYVSV